MSTYVKGRDKVLAELNKQVKEIEGRTQKGLIRGVMEIRRKMDKQPPLVPVYTGNLRASWFTVTPNSIQEGSSPQFKGKNANKLAADHSATISRMQSEIKGKVAVAMGFSANYAAEVHEKIEAKFKRPGAGAKFFQAAIYNSMNEVLEIIRKEAKI